MVLDSDDTLYSQLKFDGDRFTGVDSRSETKHPCFCIRISHPVSTFGFSTDDLVFQVNTYIEDIDAVSIVLISSLLC